MVFLKKLRSKLKNDLEAKKRQRDAESLAIAIQKRQIRKAEMEARSQAKIDFVRERAKLEQKQKLEDIKAKAIRRRAALREGVSFLTGQGANPVAPVKSFRSSARKLNSKKKATQVKRIAIPMTSTTSVSKVKQATSFDPIFGQTRNQKRIGI